jgi:signal transduction histidine kinase
MTELKNSPDSQGTENGDGNASTSGLRVAPAYLLGLSAIVGVCLSQTTTIFLPALDRELALRLEILFHILPAQVSGQPDIAHSQIDVAFGPLGIASISSMFFVLVVAVVSTLIGKLSVVPRLIGWLQLFVLSLLMHWFFFTARLQVHPVAAFSAIVYGGIIGYGWRLFNTYEKKKLSKYFEMMLRNKELQEARLQMVRQDEVDRRLLAGDLHDQVLNDLKILNQRFQS